MRIDPDDAAATVEYGENADYFCSEACHDAFVADPSRTSPDACRERSATGVTEGELAKRAGMSIEHEDTPTAAASAAGSGQDRRRDYIGHVGFYVPTRSPAPTWSPAALP